MACATKTFFYDTDRDGWKKTGFKTTDSFEEYLITLPVTPLQGSLGRKGLYSGDGVVVVVGRVSESSVFFQMYMQHKGNNQNLQPIFKSSLSCTAPEPSGDYGMHFVHGE